MWDLALDGDTGDIVFDAKNDLLGISGPQLTNQRILIRCKIPRGTWVFDETGNLGSRLYEITGTNAEASIQEARADVQEALAPMEDVSVNDVIAEVTDDGRLLVRVDWSAATAVDEPADEVQPAETTFSTQVTF